MLEWTGNKKKKAWLQELNRTEFLRLNSDRIKQNIRSSVTENEKAVEKSKPIEKPETESFALENEIIKTFEQAEQALPDQKENSSEKSENIFSFDDTEENLSHPFVKEKDFKTPDSDLFDFPKAPDVNDADAWIELFNQMYFPGMDLICVPKKNAVQENKPLFYQKRKEFLIYLSKNYRHNLRSAGLDEDALLLMERGIIGENYQIHLKIPLFYGGIIDFSNMILIQTHPYHEDIHVFINKQLEAYPQGELPEKLYLPYPNGKVFVPPSTYTGSGGKGKHDRSAFAGYSLDAYKRISLKNMPGR